jgi:O-antigen ligase
MSVKARLLQHGILLGAVIVTGLILPNSYDPVSAPKMFILAVVVGLGLVFFNFGDLKVRNWDLPNYAAVTFAILLLLNLLVNNSAFSERLFGVSGRSTGFFTLTAFLILFLIARCSLDSLVTILCYLALANVIVSGYFISQSLGFDFADYQEYYGAPSSTLGNPNFVSGFIGFSAIVFVDLARRYIRNVILVIPLSLFLIMNVWVISKANSIQGFVALGLAIFVYCLYGIYVSVSRVNFLRLSIVITLPILLIFLGFFGIGPLSQYIASTTVFSRLDYWRASLAMTFDHPLTGVGLDAYGDNYRLYRDERAIARFGETQVTDSAHNVYLDIFSYGGLPLGLAYIALNLLPLLICIRRVSLFENQSEKINQVILIALWCGFQVQTFVSVNQIGVTIWIWLILGIMASRVNRETIVKSSIKNTSIGDSILRRVPVITFSTAMVFLCLLPLQTNIKFLSAANNADGLALKSIVEKFPQDSKLIAMVASGFQNSNYSTLSLEILRQGVLHNPDSFNLWKLIYDNPKSPISLKNEALQELQRLDPRFPYSG